MKPLSKIISEVIWDNNLLIYIRLNYRDVWSELRGFSLDEIILRVKDNEISNK